MSPGNRHCRCTTHTKVRTKNPHYPLLSTLLIVLLPKCPFCLLAYTSAITMCSVKSLTQHAPQWTSYISIGLSVVTLLIVALNYKGMKTLVACLLILMGSSLIVQSELYSGLLTGYYWGCALVFLGVWVNGNFSYVVRILTSRKENPTWLHG